MVDVVVADEHPLDVFGFDDAEHVLEVLVAVLTDARVDDDRLGGLDDQRVEGDHHGGIALAVVVVDHERVGRDLSRGLIGLEVLPWLSPVGVACRWDDDAPALLKAS